MATLTVVFSLLSNVDLCQKPEMERKTAVSLFFNKFF